MIGIRSFAPRSQELGVIAAEAPSTACTATRMRSATASGLDASSLPSRCRNARPWMSAETAVASAGCSWARLVGPAEKRLGPRDRPRAASQKTRQRADSCTDERTVLGEDPIRDVDEAGVASAAGTPLSTDKSEVGNVRRDQASPFDRHVGEEILVGGRRPARSPRPQPPHRRRGFAAALRSRRSASRRAAVLLRRSLSEQTLASLPRRVRFGLHGFEVFNPRVDLIRVGRPVSDRGVDQPTGHPAIGLHQGDDRRRIEVRL